MVVRVEEPGVALRVDLAKLTDEARERTLAALEEAARRLREK